MADLTLDSQPAVSGEALPENWGLASVADYFALLKPRVMSLVIFTGVVGMILAPAAIHPVIGFAAILCLAVGAGASGALNMWYEADVDAKMSRTSSRPLPMGRVGRDEALALGMVLAIGSVVSMAFLVNVPAAILLAATIAFYATIYTMWLKPRTAQNIVIGGAAGALPPVIGWVAATGSVDLAPWSLFLIIFVWTPPHFWSLAVCRSRDYEAAGLPMMPVVAGLESTRRQIMAYSVLLVAVSVLPFAVGLAGLFYLFVALALGSVFLWLALDLVRKGVVSDDLTRLNDPLAVETNSETARAAMALFKYSLVYLFVLFAAMLPGAF